MERRGKENETEKGQDSQGRVQYDFVRPSRWFTGEQDAVDGDEGRLWSSPHRTTSDEPQNPSITQVDDRSVLREMASFVQPCCASCMRGALPGARSPALGTAPGLQADCGRTARGIRLANFDFVSAGPVVLQPTHGILSHPAAFPSSLACLRVSPRFSDRRLDWPKRNPPSAVFKGFVTRSGFQRLPSPVPDHRRPQEAAV
ncbi:hypothetical protein CIRG_01012 [Coccidioides immitis RMSCC 2394]|uniref:Uncharacterized protein n=1 Tax=Coccidioides immitis RMSCC 2394 TaxID=404692 RepID=A0A0J6XZP2_COCIT|nr:hypothetical protein CIRG_01012 [Coccidioides immitis RMSCC 2394]